MAHQDPRKAAVAEKNWDSYGGLPTTEAAIKTAESFVWVPGSDGGLSFEVIHDGVELEVEIDGAGQIKSICFSRS